MVRELQSEAEFDGAIAQGLVLVDFYAQWCKPCMKIAPKIQAFDSQYPQMQFYKVDYDEVPDVCERLGIDSLPTFLLYKDGALHETVQGADPEYLQSRIASLCSTPATRGQSPFWNLAANKNVLTGADVQGPAATGTVEGTSAVEAAEAVGDDAEEMEVAVLHHKALHKVAMLSNQPVGMLKTKLEPLTGLPAARQRLVSKGAVLQDSALLVDLQLHADSKLYLVGSRQSGDIPVPKAPPVFTEDIAAALKVCSRLNTEGAVVQPRYDFLYEAPGDQPQPTLMGGHELPPIPICEPCAMRCRKADRPRLPLDAESLDMPFSCQCACIVKMDAPCQFQELDCRPSKGLSAAVCKELQAKQKEHKARVAKQQEEASAQQRLTAEQKMTSSISQGCKQVAQYSSAVAQRRALEVLPVATLRERAAANPQKLDSPADELIVQLLHWFKGEFFTWVDTLPCPRCGAGTTNTGMTQPTPEELAWGGSRVEVHTCTECGLDTRFPRYNSPVKLLETRRGRCGEWANCFTLCCIALGYEARWVHDHTDHVWSEVWSEAQQKFVMCDPCEDTYDQPLLYEQGWGKKLTYVMAYGEFEVRDVIRKYTTNFEDVLTRRTQVTEDFLETVIDGFHRDHLRRAPAAKREVIERRWDRERGAMQTGECHGDTEHLGGRQTGSLQWRLQRGEAGATSPAPSPAPGPSNSGAGPAPAPAPKVALAFRYSAFRDDAVAAHAAAAVPAPGASDAAASLALCGQAVVRAGGLELLADAGGAPPANTGAAWHRGAHRVDTAFSTRFRLLVTDVSRTVWGGFAVVVQCSPEGVQALGVPGPGQADWGGYRGIERSVAVAFDNNSRPRCSHQPGLHVSVWAEGRLLKCASPAAILSDGEAYTITIKYAQSVLQVFLERQMCLEVSVDIAKEISSPTAAVGFTAGGLNTDGGAAGVYRLLSWSFGCQDPTPSVGLPLFGAEGDGEATGASPTTAEASSSPQRAAPPLTNTASPGTVQSSATRSAASPRPPSASHDESQCTPAPSGASHCPLPPSSSTPTAPPQNPEARDLTEAQQILQQRLKAHAGSNRGYAGPSLLSVLALSAVVAAVLCGWVWSPDAQGTGKAPPPPDPTPATDPNMGFL